MARKTPLGDLPSQPDPRAPFDAATFLRAARPVLAVLTTDLLARADASAAIRVSLERHHQAELAASRTADDYPVWRRRVVVQVATAWLLSCVFVRVLEDRGLIFARIAGPGAHDSETAFFRLVPSLGEREYLHTVFRELTRLPAAAPLFDQAHNLVWRLGPSADACKALLHLFRAPHIDAPAFRFGQPDTRFLGDLYQDLDEGVREQFALLQTPDFIESFILDRTLEPAITEYGLDHADVIDPTCGSGHFLLGAFARLYAHLRREKPGLHDRELASEALNHVYGVDINPYAVSIARFRLTLQFLVVCSYDRLLGAPAPPLHVIVADSLYYGFAGGQGDLGERPTKSPEQTATWYGSSFSLEDPDEARHILVEKSYAAVVGNPPYITVKDPALREFYRKKYTAAAGKYALSAPFMERFFQLAKKGGGYVGQITSNSFMKREFGAALIEKVLPQYALEIIINTAGAFIPGHGTPTVLVFGRNRPPSSALVNAVLAKNGEPGTPSNPAEGVVWRSIRDHWHEPDFENDFISGSKISHSALSHHPWILEGGGASALKGHLDERASTNLNKICTLGIFGMTNADECMILEPNQWTRTTVEAAHQYPIITGEIIRDWSYNHSLTALYPYHWPSDLIQLSEAPGLAAFLWKYRRSLEERATFGGGTYLSDELPWWKWHQVTSARVEGSAITYAEVATHNHFILVRSNKVYKQTAPIIKLPLGASENDHLSLVAYLNSSTTCFWMKQVAYPKGTTNGDISSEKGRPENNRYAFSTTAIGGLPVPPTDEFATLPPFAILLEHLQHQRDCLASDALLRTALDRAEDLAFATVRAEREDAALLARMVAVQEDLDWAVYAIFDLAPPETAARWTPNLELTPDQRPFKNPTPPPHLGPADRALWIFRAAAIADSKQLRLIENPVNKRRWWGARGVFAHKVATFAERVADAATERIADLTEEVLRSRCEHAVPTVVTARDLERELATHPHYQALRDYLVTQDPHVDPLRDQLTRESVPFLAGYRYSPAGLDRHARWREVWDFQRIADVSEAKLPALRDALDAATAAVREATIALAEVRGRLGDPEFRLSGAPAPRPRGSRKPTLVRAESTHPEASAKPPEQLTAEVRLTAAEDAMSEAHKELEWADTHHRKVRKLIPVPSKYEQSDFRDSNYFRLRGKLDVPRERFISYPGAASDHDAQPVYGWAGWNHLQRALALLQLYYHRKLEERWPPERLIPLLAGLEELLPWVRQWHADECHPDTGEHYADAFEAHIQAGCSELGVTRPQLLSWTPAEGRTARAKPSISNRPATAKPAEPRRATDSASQPPAVKPTNRRGSPQPTTEPLAGDRHATPSSPNSLKPSRGRARRSGIR
jgi:hypothetical protein